MNIEPIVEYLVYKANYMVINSNETGKSEIMKNNN